MADMENPEVYSLDKRSEESAYAQSRTAEQKPAAELKRDEVGAEYARLLRTLLEDIRTATKEMNMMRAEGIPDRAAYEKVRDGMTADYDRYRAVLQRMVDFSEELEDAYIAAMQGDTQEAQEPEPAKAPEEQKAVKEPEVPEPVTASEEEELAQIESLERYNKEVSKLLEAVVAMESNVELLEKNGKLEESDKEELRDMLMSAYAKLDELDQAFGAGVAESSREKESLLTLIKDLDRKLRPAAVAASTSGTPSATQDQVKARYVVALNERGETLEEAITRKDEEEVLRSEELKELYDEEVEKLLADALEVEADVELFAKKNKLDEIRPAIHTAIATILEKLEKLNEQRTDTAPSRESKSIKDVLGKIEKMLEEPVKAEATASPLAGIHATHNEVKAQYAAVQHMLTEEQRREMRTRIAQLSALVRQAEDDAWVDALKNSTPPPASETDIRSAIRLAVARASENAGVIAEAVVGTPASTPKRGILGVLGDAFKLK